MNDNMNNENEYETEKESLNSPEKSSWVEGSGNTLKFLTICLSAFLGGFLAIFALSGIMYYGHSKSYSSNPNPFSTQSVAFDEFFVEKEMEKVASKLTKDFFKVSPEQMEGAYESKPRNFQPVVDFQEIQGAYKVIVNLKNFNNDEKNLKLDISSDEFEIDGKYSVNSEKGQSTFKYSQSMSLAKPIDVSAVTKEKIGDKYVITLPFKN